MKRTIQALFCALFCAVLHLSAAAGTVFVTNNSNSGAGSLRDAITGAAAGDTVLFAAGVTGKIVLTSGPISINKPLTIIGPGAKTLMISGNNASRVFNVNDNSLITDSAVSISDLTLTEGYAGNCTGPVVANGGAIAVNESLTLTNVVIRDSFASGNGGGLSFGPTKAGQALTIQGAEILNNVAGCVGATSNAQAGGMNLSVDSAADPTAGATILVEDSRIEGNVAVRFGGGIRYLTPGSATLRNVRIRGNSAASVGGGILAVYPSPPPVIGSPPALLIDSSEISGNSAGSTTLAGAGVYGSNSDAGGQAAGSALAVTVRNSTISSNQARNGSAGGVAVNGNVALVVQNSTIADNGSGQLTSGSPLGGGIHRQIGVQSGTATPDTEGTVSISSSIIANNRGTAGTQDLGQEPAETFANAIALNQSLVGTTPALTPTPTGSANIIAQDPLLRALGDYGGPTFTHALAAGSPAVDAGSNPASATSDQRGLARTVGGATDMGAFESGNVIPLGCLDPDGNGIIDALTDGVLLVRATLGLTLTGATSHAIGPGAIRDNWAAIRKYLNGNCAANFLP